MEEGDGIQGVLEMPRATAMVAQNSPVLQAGDRMLDPRAAAAMAAPGQVAQDAIAAEDRRDELGHAAVAAIGQNAPVVLAERLDRGATVVDGIVAIARSPGGRRDDAEVAAASQDLSVA